MRPPKCALVGCPCHVGCLWLLVPRSRHLVNHPSPPSSCPQVGSNMLRYHLRPLAKKGLDTGEQGRDGVAPGALEDLAACAAGEAG